MATILSSLLQIRTLTELHPDTALGDSGPRKTELHNGTTGRRWTHGTASGQADRNYRRIDRTLAIGATDSYNLLAAGALTDPNGQAIDLDELKGLVLYCSDGEVNFEGPGALDLPLFKAPGNGIVLSAGQMVAFDLGAAGLTLGASASFDITETDGAGSTYSLILFGAQ